MTDLPDALARRRILNEFGTTFFVEAAAGTGKTTALVGRIVGMVRAGAGALKDTVAVTFTEKASGELKLRLRSEIERARREAAADERARLDRALEELELARIGTIHGFCGDLLHERPIEAGVDPLFEVTSEEEAEALADEAFGSWFERVLSAPPEGVRRILRRRSGYRSPREELRTALRTFIQHRDFPHPWRRDPFERDHATDRLMDELAEIGSLACLSSWPEDRLARNLGELARFVDEATRLEAVRGRDYDGLEAELRLLARRRSWTWSGSPRTTFGQLSRDETLARRNQAKAHLDAFVAASGADLAPLLHQALQTAIAKYERLKAKRGRLDFLDLLIKARDLIRGNIVVRNELQQRFEHFFVDEFQDTDPLQAEILLLLGADQPDETDWGAARPLPGKLFFVGDPKQAIYRFRRADVGLYEAIKQRLVGSGAELLHLTTSFRAPPSIQSFVNGAFAPAIAVSVNGDQAAYVPLDPWRPENTKQPTLIALPVPKPYSDYGRITKGRIAESLPNAVGAFVSWLVNESGWEIEEEGATVPVRPRHIAILFRQFRNFGNEVTRPYVRALEARRIPHVLVGGRSYHDREEVIALRIALAAIESPEDELKVFATLRGPFFALSDAALLLYRQGAPGTGEASTRRLDPRRPVNRAALLPQAVEVADALNLLRTLHLGRNHRPIASTITMLLEAVRAHAGLALWPTGEQALANCQRLIDSAHRFDRSAPSFRAFVEKLEAEAERGEADEAPIVEEGTEGIRIMTVHKAKGLEFPVVILADPTCAASRSTPSHHVDPHRRLWLERVCDSMPCELQEAADEELRKEKAEATRIAYVAATRARDLLVAPVCGDEPIEGWLSVLDQMLYPPGPRRGSALPGLNCPGFGTDSVLDRGPNGIPPVGGPIRPGTHRSEASGPWVVWWDPAVLQLEVDEPAPLRQQGILELDAAGAAAASETMYATWREAREALLATASKPSLSLRTASSLTGGELDSVLGTTLSHQSSGEIPTSTVHDRIIIERIDRSDGERPGGRRFGALVHTILASFDFGRAEPAVETVAALHGRRLAATDAEIDAATTAVNRMLAHPILQQAQLSAAERELRREVPILLALKDGTLIEGVADLAFREVSGAFDGWTVVDFKTDREFSASSTRYMAQLAAYMEAIRTATGLPTRGVLLVV